MKNPSGVRSLQWAATLGAVSLALSGCGGGQAPVTPTLSQPALTNDVQVSELTTVTDTVAHPEPVAPEIAPSELVVPTAPSAPAVSTTPTGVTPNPAPPSSVVVSASAFNAELPPPVGTALNQFIQAYGIQSNAAMSPLTTVTKLTKDREGQQRIGANIGWVRPFGRNHEYVDLVMQAGGFGLQGRYGTSGVPLGADGWPLGDFSIELMTAQGETRNLNGVYTVVYDGEATVNVLVSKISLSNKRKDPSTGKWLIDLTFPAGAVNMGLDFILTKGADGKPVAPVKNLQVIRPGYDWRNPPTFTTPFLNHVRRFAVLRFMDWLDTNQEVGMAKGPEGIWANRPTPTNKRTGAGANLPRGQSWERIVELCNEVGSDAWINVPPNANAEYFVELARFFKANLKPGLKVYVEYGNEMWNGAFLQTQTIWNDALAEVKAGTPLGNKLNYDNTYVAGLKDANGNTVNQDGTKYKLGWRLYAERLINISDAFRSVYGSAAMMTTVRPVLAWQVVSPSSTNVLLDYTKVVYGKAPSDYFYAMAGAPYYGLAKATADRAAALRKQAEAAKASDPSVDLDAPQYTISVNELLVDMASVVRDNPVRARFEANVMLARKNKLKWVAYEGGPDTFGIASAKNKAQASRDPAMFEICQASLNGWSSNGGDLFMWFQAGAGPWDGAYGSWPLVESITEVWGAKTVCMDWATVTPAPQAVSRHPLPGILSPAEDVRFNGATGAEAMLPLESSRKLNTVGIERDYVVSSTNAACYKLVLNAKNVWYGGTTNLPIEIWVNGDKQINATALLDKRWALDETRDFNMGQVCVPAGISAFTVKLVGAANLVMNSFTFTP